MLAFCATSGDSKDSPKMYLNSFLMSLLTSLLTSSEIIFLFLAQVLRILFFVVVIKKYFALDEMFYNHNKL